MDSVCDAVIFVDANPTTRLARVMQTRNWDTSMLERREDSQMSLDEKRKRADYVVLNDDDLNGLKNQLNQILDRIAPPVI